jgi:hypothetical protein
MFAEFDIGGVHHGPGRSFAAPRSNPPTVAFFHDIQGRFLV